MFEIYYVIRWTYRYTEGEYYYSKCKQFEEDWQADEFKRVLFERPDIEIVEWSKERIEHWKVERKGKKKVN